MTLRDQLQSALGSAYSIERELGGGGMSRVFIATENRLHRSVVVKVLSPELASGVSAERFEREIQLVAQLQQANIVPLLSTGETNGIPYYMMPFVEGESLRARLAKTGALPVASAVGILRDVARALSYAHAHGIVHRDIKPDNVLLSHGAAVVTDFGIAKAVSAARTQSDGPSITQTGTSIGTPTYMAPEQAAGDANIDHRVDIYAFGCLAYELLAGHPPFTGTSPQRVLVGHLTEKPRPIRELRAEVPGVLATLVMQCLEKPPASRPATADEIVGRLEAMVTPSGEQPAAFGAKPMRLLARPWRAIGIAAAVVAVVTIGILAGNRATGSAAVDKSIAVLPLANLSGDASNDYFGEGLAEEITNALGKAGLHVIGRGSARALAAKGMDARAIARELGVGSVLQGTVQRAEQRMRITVNLTSATDGALLWSSRYDRELKDVFAVQDEIARSVASELRVTMAGPAQRLVRNETTNPEAHALYLQGLYQWNRRSPRSLRQAIALFEQAAQLDPQYARAHAGIAMAYVVLPVYDEVPPDEMIAKALQAADRALRIDSTLVEAHATLAYAYACLFRNADAERSFARAIGVDSNSATAHFWFSLWLNAMGRFHESLAETERARALEPASLVIMASSGVPLYSSGRYKEADSASRRVLAIEPTFQISVYWHAMSLAEMGALDSAVAVLGRIVGVEGLRPSAKVGMLAYLHARAGRAAEARAVLARAMSPGSRQLPAVASIAAALDALGDRTAALDVFTRAVEQHDQFVMLTAVSAPFNGLRRDPRGAPLFARIRAP